MKTTTYTLELLTPCFCAGADQSKAEIRAPSIRGQLRWWFRTLGGFKSLAGLLKQQEAQLFGTTAGDEGTSSQLLVRVTQPLTASVEKNGDSPEANVRAATGYILFPLRNKTRGAIENGTFTLTIQWRGEAKLWGDIQNLIAVFTHFGSLGFRSRRGYGAIGPAANNKAHLAAIQIALDAFNCATQALEIRTLPACQDCSTALTSLANWLKGWRSHGRSSFDLVNGRPRTPSAMPGFDYAKADHDAGYGMNQNGPTYRAALGLPIIQRCDRTTNNWEYATGNNKGRFASPVLLRPHKTANGQILPLVIFVDAHAWPENQVVYLNGQPRQVSTDLYNAMRVDPKLKALV